MRLAGLAVVVAEQRRAAFRTLLLGGLIPRHKGAVGIVAASEIGIAALGFAPDDLTAAFRAGDAGLLDNRLGIFALRIARAGEKLAEPAGFDDHFAPAKLADDIGFLVLDLDALSLEILFRLLQRGLKVAVETAQNLDIGHFAAFDLVQLLFHMRRKGQVGDRGELIHKQLRDALAERGRAQTAPLLHDVVPRENGRNRRRIGGRAADALFLHRLDERCFGIARRRLREVLCRRQLPAGERIALVEIRQRLAGAGIALAVVRRLLINRGKAGKCHLVAARTEHIALRQNICRNRVQNRLCHLAGHKPAPDQLIQLVLLGCQVRLQVVRRHHDIGRTNGLVGVLRVVFRAEHALFRRIILRTIALHNEILGRGCRLIGQPQRVGTHIGNQTGQTCLADLNAFIQLLCDRHRAARRHAQLAARLLLQRRSDKRRGRIFAFFAAANLAHGKRLAGNSCHDGVRLRLVLQLHLSAGIAVKRCGKHAARRCGKLCLQRPVFLRHKGADFFFPVNDHARRHRLHAARRQTALDLPPEEGGQLVAHNAVENAPRLLCVDQIEIDVARMGNAFLHGTLCDLVKGHAL